MKGESVVGQPDAKACVVMVCYHAFLEVFDYHFGHSRDASKAEVNLLRRWIVGKLIAGMKGRTKIEECDG